MHEQAYKPTTGRKGYAGDRGFGCRTRRQAHTAGVPGVEIGERVKIENRSSNAPHGWWLTCEEAEELAQHLLACAAWSRAQRALDSIPAEAEGLMT